MNNHEGSVSTEDSDFDESEEESTDEDTGTENVEGETSTTDEEASSTDSTLTQEPEQDKAERTEKGTKLDPDPLSRANQELANERAKIRQYEEVLQNPDMLKKYVSTFDKDGEKGQKTEEPELRYEDVQTTEDLHKFLAQQDRKIQDKVKELDQTISHVQSSQRSNQVADRIKSDVAAVQGTYPELDPKSDQYSEELDTSVGQLYELYDFDPQTKSFRGQVSIKQIADIVMKAAVSSKRKGSEETQTIVRDRRTGKAVSGASQTAPDESSMTTGQIIASRIKAARGR